MRNKLVHVQSLLSEKDLEKLKAVTKEESTKDAIFEAIQYYLAHRDRLLLDGRKTLED